MFLLFGVLANDSMDDSLEDVLLWHDALHVLDQVVCISDLVVLQIENDQVESGLWDHVHEWGQHLQCVLTSSEYDQIVSKQIIILEHVASSACVLKSFEFCLGCFAIVELEMVASFEVDANN